MICKPGIVLPVLLAMGLTGCIGGPMRSANCPIPGRADIAVTVSDRALWAVPPSKSYGFADDGTAPTGAP